MRLDHASRIQLAVRTGVCVDCERRPAGSERWSGRTRRPCEAECPIFANVPRLIRIVNQGDEDHRVDLASVLRDGICLDCHACRQPLANRFTGCKCSLRSHHQQVAGLIEAIVIPACGCD